MALVRGTVALPDTTAALTALLGSATFVTGRAPVGWIVPGNYTAIVIRGDKDEKGMLAAARAIELVAGDNTVQFDAPTTPFALPKEPDDE
ncbi:MAG: hypothetical protein H0U59_04435 [Gemmatimonadaceae bacterium]|nr:hypothetical protein [Gemmatimonadaceae bacterium]